MTPSARPKTETPRPRAGCGCERCRAAIAAKRGGTNTSTSSLPTRPQRGVVGASAALARGPLITETIGRPAECQVMTHRDVEQLLVGTYGQTQIFRATCRTCGAGWQLRREER